MFLSIVFSFRNEEKGLEELVRRVKSSIKPVVKKYEIIFVNDDSSDASLEILLKLRKKDTNIKIINMSRRFGVHPCVIAGLRHAKGNAVVYMDSDLQDPPELIPQLVEKWKSGAEVVNTVRKKRLGENIIKLWITKFAYKIINSISSIDLPSNMGDFKLLDRRGVNELLKIEEADPFMRGLIRWVGFKQETVYYVRESRFTGDTHFSLFGSGPAKEFIRGIASFSTKPLYFVIFLGLLVSFASFVMIVYVFIIWTKGLAVPGWAGVMLTLLLLGGMILISNGVNGIYIGRVYEQVKHRPLYIIKDKTGFNR
jgi:polyisoprenyl-phosphate glycosyltransferase